jgi:regulator of RNase E activity RraA
MLSTSQLTERLERCYTGVIHDTMRAMGLRDFTLPPELRPLMPEKTLAGPAFTIQGKVDRTADPHETLLAWTGLLSKAPAGSIWTSQPNDRVVALGFQTWSRGFTPRDIVGYWLPAATEVPIRIGEVDIAPGDYLVGDRDGMIRVPVERVEQVLERSEQAMSTESKVRKAILEGVDPQQAYLQFGKF